MKRLLSGLQRSSTAWPYCKVLWGKLFEHCTMMRFALKVQQYLQHAAACRCALCSCWHRYCAQDMSWLDR